MAVRAFRDLTAAGDEAAATRARVLDTADRAARRHASPRRVLLPTIVGLLIVCTAAVAGTTLARRWRRPATVAGTEPTTAAPPLPQGGRHAIAVVPPVAAGADDAPAAEPSEAESAAYGRAHRAHFDGADPARVLAAWDHYLRLYPRGTFAPEARFNRALCLVHLGRFNDAERALRPFAEEHLGGYRRAEAEQLLAWLRERPTAP